MFYFENDPEKLYKCIWKLIEEKENRYHLHPCSVCEGYGIYVDIRTEKFLKCPYYIPKYKIKELKEKR